MRRNNHLNAGLKLNPLLSNIELTEQGVCKVAGKETTIAHPKTGSFKKRTNSVVVLVTDLVLLDVLVVLVMVLLQLTPGWASHTHPNGSQSHNVK